jgi:ComF family protein
MAGMLAYAFHLHGQRPSMPEFITFVPLSEKRELERGFNQAEQMARDLGRKLRLPVVPLLQRQRHTEKQSLKSRSSRLEDLQDVFSLIPEAPKQIQTPSRIYVVDDVYTTGSTLNQCAKTIRSRLDAEVYGVTWAR